MSAAYANMCSIPCSDTTESSLVGIDVLIHSGSPFAIYRLDDISYVCMRCIIQ